MFIKRAFPYVLIAALVAGCGAPSKGLRQQDLRTSANFVTEVVLGDMDFPTLQRNLFQHRAACGSAPRFIMEKGQTGYAMLFETAEVPVNYENVILAELTQYPETMLASNRVAMRIYSYYYNDAVQQRVDAMLDAVRRPGVCGSENGQSSNDVPTEGGRTTQ